MKLPGLSRSKFQNFFLLANVVLSIAHTSAEEESLFSRVRKNLNAQRTSIVLDGTLDYQVSLHFN